MDADLLALDDRDSWQVVLEALGRQMQDFKHEMFETMSMITGGLENRLVMLQDKLDLLDDKSSVHSRSTPRSTQRQNQSITFPASSLSLVSQRSANSGNAQKASTSAGFEENKAESFDVSDIAAKRENEKRRSTIFGKPAALKATTPAETPVSQPVVMNLLTRNSFPNVELRSFNLEHVTIFLDDYSQILERYPGHVLRMVDFIAKALHPKLTITALKLGFLSTDSFGAGVRALTDDQVKECILEVLKARSADDFIVKITSLKFPIPEGDRAFTPSALNFPTLYDRALLFSHRYTKVLQLIAQRADHKHIPPLYKEGKTLGMVDYFLNAWPNDSGNSLYSRITIHQPTLRMAENFQSFTTAFFLALADYKEIQQSVLDLDSVLSKKPKKTYDNTENAYRGSQSHRGSNERGKSSGYQQKPPYIHQHAHNIDEDLYDTYEVHDEFEEDNPEAQEGLAEDEDDSPVMISEAEPSAETAVDTVAAIKGKDDKKECWYHFRYGCTKGDCKLLHDKESMIKYQDARLKEIFAAKFAEPDSILKPKIEKMLRERASAQANKKA